MSKTVMTPLALLAAATALSLAGAPASPAHGESRWIARPAQPSSDVLVIYSAGLSEALSSPKDAGLREAMGVAERRLVELARMSGNMPNPERNISTIWTLATSPMTLRLAAVDGGEVPIALQLQSRPADIAATERALLALFRDAEVQTRAGQGGREFDTPMGLGRLSTSGRGQDAALTLSIGEMPPPAQVNWDLPAGVTPVFGFHANLRAAQPLFEAMLDEMPDGDELAAMLGSTGVLGQNAIVTTAAVGHGPDGGILRGTVHGLRPIAPELGLPEGVTLGADLLALIPADATYVQASVFSLAMLDALLETAEVRDMLHEVGDQLGIDLAEDVLGQIGNRFAVYQSDRTGGGGILSTVGILELRDGERFGAAHRRMADTFNDFAADQGGPVSVEVRARRSAGMEFFTLTWPGIPIPAEISWTVHGDRLFVAMSPRSLLEAVAQAAPGSPSFARNARVAEVAGGDPAALLSISYTDMPRFAVQGYSLVNLMLAGLSNALRTKDGPDPGIPLPPFADFIRNIRPSVTISRWAGDDLKYEGRFDSSMLVNLAGSPTTAMLPAMVAAGTGVVMPAMSRARGAAIDVKAASQVRTIGMAMVMYSVDNNDRLPASLEDLWDYLPVDDLHSPYGPCWDGTPDYAIRTDLANRTMASIRDPHQTIAVIDRASIYNAGSVIVGFLDGHVRTVYNWELTELLAEESNRGALEAMGLPEWLSPGF